MSETPQGGNAHALLVSAQDGSYDYTAGNPKKNICDFQGCTVTGGCNGVAICSGTVSCSTTVPSAAGVYRYFGCSGQNSKYVDIFVNCNGCYIGGTCYSSGTANPTNSCQWCDAAQSGVSWSNKGAGACAGGVCNAGGCCAGEGTAPGALGCCSGLGTCSDSLCHATCAGCSASFNPPSGVACGLDSGTAFMVTWNSITQTYDANDRLFLRVGENLAEVSNGCPGNIGTPTCAYAQGPFSTGTASVLANTLQPGVTYYVRLAQACNIGQPGFEYKHQIIQCTTCYPNGWYAGSSGTCCAGLNKCADGTCQASCGEDCSNNIDDDGDGYIDETDNSCPITLTASPSTVLPLQAVSLVTTANDGVLTTTGHFKSICDYQGCRADGSCAGTPICPNTLSCTISAPSTQGAYGYYACTGKNSAEAYVTVSCGGCTIGGVCYPIGQVNPGNSCQWCQGGSSWTDNNGASCGTGACTGGVCINCDQDGDGARRTDIPACAGTDCNDLDASIYPNANEGLRGWCADGKENNCPGDANYGRADYDYFTNGAWPPESGIGDLTCPVGITNAAMPPGVPINTPFIFNCTATASRVRSIVITTTAGVTCNPNAGVWTGNVFQTPCTTTVYSGTLSCSINASRSAVTPPPRSVAFSGDCGAAPAPNCAAVCDQDGDGYNRSILVGAYQVCASTRPFDCADTNAAVNPGVSETGVLCTNGVDDNCNGEADYNGTAVYPHGDVGCPIAVANMVVAGPNCYGSAGYAMVNCTYTRPTSQQANVSQGVVVKGCDFFGWSGMIAQFGCPTTAPFGRAAATFRCTVNSSTSYETPPDQMRMVRLRGPTENCDGTTGVCNSTGACIYDVRWRGNVTDVTIGERVGVAANVSLENGTWINAPLGAISVDHVRVGLHNLSGRALGYDERTIFTVNFSHDPEFQDVPLTSSHCTPQCTLNGVCDFRCIGLYGCGLNASLTPQENGRITAVCQYAPPESTRRLNDTHTVVCCTGPILPTSFYQVPLRIASCSPTLVPHKTIVNNNGRIMYLTVLSYTKCDHQ
jgi:hypothetical protein